ncbi:MAG: response regulator transcription factor [Chloroflexi bacterium]|nr:response regulator transcription factor [Chloroflexota bacterium]
MQRARPSAHILYVEDEPLIRRMVEILLGDAGYQVSCVDNATAALRILHQNEVHLLILDVSLPQMDGRDFCRKLREDRFSVPVLFLSAHGLVEDKLSGFNVGADDYMAKPFEPRELLARVRALLGRQFWGTANMARSRLRVGGLELDLGELVVKLPNGDQEVLTPTEMRVLQCLMRYAGRVVTRELLLSEAWGYDYESDSNPVEVYVRRVRRKIESDSAHPLIETVRGVGYRLINNSSSAGVSSGLHALNAVS